MMEAQAASKRRSFKTKCDYRIWTLLNTMQINISNSVELELIRTVISFKQQEMSKSSDVQNYKESIWNTCHSYCKLVRSALSVSTLKRCIDLMTSRSVF
jgi:hypothetical protein